MTRKRFFIQPEQYNQMTSGSLSPMETGNWRKEADTHRFYFWYWIWYCRGGFEAHKTQLYFANRRNKSWSVGIGQISPPSQFKYAW